MDDVLPAELRNTYEALGDSWYRASQFDSAAIAFQQARRMNVDDDPLADARLLLKRCQLEEKLGQYSKALRWGSRARTAIAGASGAAALRQAAQINAYYSTVLQLAGKSDDAIRWAERTVIEAKAAGDVDALGTAYIVLGLARGARGEPGAEQHWRDALEAFQRAGNLVRQPALLINIGLACQWDGRWDEALEYYERGRDENIKIGNNVNAAIARLNIAEILIDRGEWSNAETLLKETLPFWKAAKYQYFLAGCFVMLGRLWLGSGKIDEAAATLQDAKAKFLQVGAAGEVAVVDARIAECCVHQGKADQALEMVQPMLDRAPSSKPIAKLVPQLQRIRALAFMSVGKLREARAAAEAGLSVARARNEAFETALTLRVLVEIDRASGVPPSDVLSQESEALLAKFKVSEPPRLPTIRQTA